MTNIQMFILSILIVGTFSLVFLLIFKTPNSKGYYVSSANDLDPALKKLLKTFGPDVLGLVPPNMVAKKTKDEELSLLIRRAGNPWDLDISEFVLLKYVLAILGGILGIVLATFIGFAVNPLLGFISGLILPIFGWLYPNTTYEKLAAKRDMDFRKGLPPSIDLLIMALSGGNYTLINGIEEIIPHMEDGPVKDEFKTIIRDVDSGMSTADALTAFSERVPTDGIKAFVRALVNANKLSVDMTTILEARATESRKELRDEAEKRIAALPMKVMLVLSPASAFAIMIIAIAPFAFLLMQFF